MKNKEVMDSIYDLTQCVKSNYPKDLKIIMDYIERLEHENLGLRQQVANMKRKEEARYKSDAWVD